MVNLYLDYQVNKFYESEHHMKNVRYTHSYTRGESTLSDDLTGGCIVITIIFVVVWGAMLFGQVG